MRTTPLFPALFASLFAGLFAGCASAPESTTATYDMQIVGERVTLAFQRLPLKEFILVAQKVTKRAYTYHRDLGDVGPFTLVGRLECQRSEFGEFFASMLRTHGLVTEEVGDDPHQIIVVRRA